MLDFWIKTRGIPINILTVLIGTLLGFILRNRISKSGQEIITQAVSFKIKIASFLPALLLAWIVYQLVYIFTD